MFVQAIKSQACAGQDPYTQHYMLSRAAKLGTAHSQQSWGSGQLTRPGVMVYRHHSPSVTVHCCKGVSTTECKCRETRNTLSTHSGNHHIPTPSKPCELPAASRERKVTRTCAPCQTPGACECQPTGPHACAGSGS